MSARLVCDVFVLLVDAWFLTHFSPFAAIEEQGSWMARAKSGEVFMFERAVIVDRSKYLILFCDLSESHQCLAPHSGSARCGRSSRRGGQGE